MFSRNSVMVDIESLDVKPGGVILSIGAVKFDPYSFNTFEELLEDSFQLRIKLSSSLSAGYNINADTLCWWMQQDDDARKSLFLDDEIAEPIGTVLRAFVAYLKKTQCGELWSNGHMDISMINVYAQGIFGADIIHYRKWCDMRTFQKTMCSTTEEMWPIEKPPKMIPHNAAHDSAYQAMIVQQIIRNHFLVKSLNTVLKPSETITSDVKA